MKIVVAEHKIIDLSESLLNELDDIQLKGLFEVDSAIALNHELRVLPMVSDFLSMQLDAKQLSAKSAKTYGKNIGYCLEYLLQRKEFAGFDLDEPFLTVTKAVLQEYFSGLSKHGVGGKTIRNRDAALKSFFDKYLCSERLSLRVDNPYTDGMLSANTKSGFIEGCTIEELKSLMLCTDSEKERMFLQFMFDSGVRRSEVSRVSLADIKEALHFQKSKFYVNTKDTYITSKGYYPLRIAGSKGQRRETKERLTLISAATLDRINKYHSTPLYKKHQRKYRKAEETPAFFNARGKPISADNVDSLLKKTSEKAVWRNLTRKHISPHKLRHGNAYEILQSPDFGEEYLDRLVHIQKTYGHSQLSTSEGYTKIPIELFDQITDERGQVLTKSQKMEKLYKETKLKIKIGDRK